MAAEAAPADAGRRLPDASPAPPDARASQPDAVGVAAETAAGSPPRCSLRINEVQTSGALGALDEFVEIANTCPQVPVDLTGYKLSYRAARGAVEYVRVSFGQIAVSDYIVAGNEEYPGRAEVRFAEGLRDEGGGLALRDGSGAVVDSVGWGPDTDNEFVESRPAPAPPRGLSISRTGDDTNVNARDFGVASPTPGKHNEQP